MAGEKETSTAEEALTLEDGLMKYEWETWKHVVVKEFDNLGIDINHPTWDRLISGIELWGEELATLRYGMKAKICARALGDHRIKYEASCARHPVRKE